MIIICHECMWPRVNDIQLGRNVTTSSDCYRHCLSSKSPLASTSPLNISIRIAVVSIAKRSRYYYRPAREASIYIGKLNRIAFGCGESANATYIYMPQCSIVISFSPFWPGFAGQNEKKAYTIGTLYAKNIYIKASRNATLLGQRTDGGCEMRNIEWIALVRARQKHTATE